MLDQVEAVLPRLFVDPHQEHASVLIVREQTTEIVLRTGVLQPLSRIDSLGALVTVTHQGGLGYAATADLSEAGLAAALDRARRWARASAGRSVLPTDYVPPHPKGRWNGPVVRPWASSTLAEQIGLLQAAGKGLGRLSGIVDWAAGLSSVKRDMLLLTNGGGRVEQHLELLNPGLRATAHRDGDTQSRSTRDGLCRQGGLEILDEMGWEAMAEQLGAEAIELLDAENCPTGTMDLVLAPDQMMLQIHESIGHPLELDRILGDERNYAGTSFVTPDMFGTYQYGSPLLNVTFDPTHANELARYGFDAEGAPATREFLIRDGLLVRGLGSLLSQARSGLPGVACARVTSWNRPPIDRMANLNVEPGDLSLDQLLGGIERGVYMETNQSWSIDDSRNKFQFGCERGRLIVDGKLGPVVKNPNYRGISATFWRSLDGVGDPSTYGVYGTPYCGKGEPNQTVRVGHASPACRFRNIDVFGGEA